MRSRKEGVGAVGRAFAGRRLGLVLATAGLLALSLTSAAAASPANAARVHQVPRIGLPGGTWSLENWRHPGLCLSSGGVIGGTVKVYTCTGSSNQHWHAGSTHGTSPLAYQQLRNGDGQCLGISGGSASAGAHAVMGNCGSSDTYYWLMELPQIYNIPHFQNQHSQLVIQIACNCGTNGAVVDQEPYNGGNPGTSDENQGWFLRTF